MRVLLILVLICGCGGVKVGGHAPEQLLEDAGSLDGGDAGDVDAGPEDAGELDAGPPDAGPVYCRPCQMDADCGEGNYCVPGRAPDAGTHCGQACHVDSDCPDILAPNGGRDPRCILIGTGEPGAYRPIPQCFPDISGRCW